MGKVYEQVYSIIKMSQDGLKEALEAISRIGYDGVQIIGTNDLGMGTEGFRKFVTEDLQLDLLAAHALYKDEELEFAAKLGVTYCDVPVHPNDNKDDVLRCAEELNALGAKYKQYGLTAILHQHSQEFIPFEGEEICPYDVLLQNTDPALVGFELDIGWALRAGAKPEEYIRKYAGRFPVIHAKECNEISPDVDGMLHFPKKMLELGPPVMINGTPQWRPEQIEIVYNSRSWNGQLGTGLIDWKAVIEAAEAQGCQAYINEREYYHFADMDGDVFRCAESDYEFLRSLGI